MPLSRPAFTSKRLEEERAEDKRTVIPVSLNEDEWRQMEDAMRWLDTTQRSTALKFLVDVGYNVLQQTFGRERLNWLFKKDRPRRRD